MRELKSDRPPARPYGAEETAPLRLGRTVWCSDGPVGPLTDVVIDPGERRVTHVVVETPDGKARLVPARLLTPGRRSDGGVVLSCGSADLDECDSIRSFSFVGLDELPHGDDRTDVGVEDVQVLPGLGAAELGDYAGDFGTAYGVTYDLIPAGSAELRHGSAAVSEDGEEMGSVDGFLVAGERLTHVVLQRTRLSRVGAAAIPIDSVAAIETDRVVVAISELQA